MKKPEDSCNKHYLNMPYQTRHCVIMPGPFLKMEYKNTYSLGSDGVKVCSMSLCNYRDDFVTEWYFHIFLGHSIKNFDTF